MLDRRNPTLYWVNDYLWLIPPCLKHVVLILPISEDDPTSQYTTLWHLTNQQNSITQTSKKDDRWARLYIYDQNIKTNHGTLILLLNSCAEWWHMCYLCRTWNLWVQYGYLSHHMPGLLFTIFFNMSIFGHMSDASNKPYLVHFL